MATTVTSVLTCGGRRGARGRWRGRRRGGRRSGRDRQDPRAAVGAGPDGLDLRVRAVEQGERLAAGRHAIQASRAVGADEHVAGVVHGQRGDVGGRALEDLRRRAAGPRQAVDAALAAGGDVHLLLAVHREGPDVGLLRIEEHGGLAVWRDAIDLAVGRRAGQQRVAVPGERVDLQFLAVPEHARLVARHRDHLAIVAGADVERAVRRGRGRPERRRRIFVDHADRGAEREPAIPGHRHLLAAAGHPLIAAADLPARRARGAHGQRDDRRRDGDRQEPSGHMCHVVLTERWE